MGLIQAQSTMRIPHQKIRVPQERHKLASATLATMTLTWCCGGVDGCTHYLLNGCSLGLKSQSSYWCGVSSGLDAPTCYLPSCKSRQLADLTRQRSKLVCLCLMGLCIFQQLSGYMLSHSPTVLKELPALKCSLQILCGLFCCEEADSQLDEFLPTSPTWFARTHTHTLATTQLAVLHHL